MKTLNRKLAAASLLFTAVLAAPGFAGEKAKDYTQTALVAVTVSTEVSADAGKVWKQFTQKDALVKMIGLQEATGSEALGDVGAKLCGRLGGDEGNLVVTHISLENEIRYSWEPDNGAYVCHIALKLMKSGNGTKVTLTDAYSDEKPAMIGKNAQDSRMHLAQSLESLKKAVM